MTMTLVETIEVGAGGAASIEFTSIPQDGVDLLLKLSLRTDSTNGTINCYFNSDTTATNYTVIRLYGTGSGVASESYNAPYFAYADKSSETANTFSSGSLYISNYTSSSAKSLSSDMVKENNATAAEQLISAGRWSGTSGITSILLDPASDPNFVQYSTASLYKITKA